MNRATRRQAFGTALARAREEAGYSRQADLAEELGVDQRKVSQWERGKIEPDREMMPLIELALELPPGTLTRHLGYLPLNYDPNLAAEPDVITAVISDHRLDDDGRSALFATYRAVTNRRR